MDAKELRLKKLKEISSYMGKLKLQMEELAVMSRLEGASWTEIADSMNVTRQAAQSRFGAKVKNRTKLEEFNNG